MRKILIISFTLALLSLSVLAGTGKIQFENTHVVINKIEQGKVAKAKYKFKNTGTDTLIIKRVKPGWGCTTSSLEKKKYKPGETGIIEVELKTNRYYGKVNKGIVVTTDSTLTPVIQLQLTVNVIADLRPLNTNLRFRNVTANKEFTKSIEIENNMDKPFKIRGIEINDRMLMDKSYEIKADTEKLDGKDFIVFHLKKTNNDYRFNNVSIPVTILTNSEKVKKLQFYMIVRLQRPIEIDPSSIYMYSTKIGNKRVKRITVKSNTGKPLLIKNINSNNKDIAFEIAKESDFITHVWVGVKESASPGRISGVISIDVGNEGNNNILKVPVRGTIVK